MVHPTTSIIITLTVLVKALCLTSSFSLTSRQTSAFATRNTFSRSAANILFPSSPLKPPNLRHVFVRNLALLLTAKLEASLLSVTPTTLHVQGQQPQIQCIQDFADIGAEMTGMTDMEGTVTTNILSLPVSYKELNNSGTFSVATIKSKSLLPNWNDVKKLGAPPFIEGDDTSHVKPTAVNITVKLSELIAVKQPIVTNTKLQTATTDETLMTMADTTTNTISKVPVVTKGNELMEIHPLISEFATQSLTVTPAAQPTSPQMSSDIANPPATKNDASSLDLNQQFRSTKLEQQIPPTNREARILEARIQPKTPEVEAALKQKYLAITSVEERAFTILFDLGMIDITGEEDEEEE